MYCQNCGTQQDDNAQFCQKCGQSMSAAASQQQAPTPQGNPTKPVKVKKPFYKRVWFWVIVVLVVIGAIGSSGGSKTAETSATSTNSSNKTVSSSSMAESSKEESKSSSQESAPTEKILTEAGESLETKYFNVTIESVKKLEPTQFLEPSEGNEFIGIGILIENLSTDDYNVSSMLMFNAYADDMSMSESFTAHSADDTGTMDGALAAGKKLRGMLAYEVPQDWKEIEVQVDLTMLKFSNDGKFKIIISHDSVK